jgi:hypothetical protein
MVSQPWDYPWSSCRAYASGQPDPLLTMDPNYMELSPQAERRQRLWREFLLGEDPREGRIREGDWAIGDDDFQKQLAQALGWPTPRRRGRPRRQTRSR